MNKDQYRKALSGVRPSGQSMERIMNMTEQKTKQFKKGWIIALAAAVILLCALFTANAATDGALFDGTMFQNLKIRLNGKEYDMNDYLDLAESTTDKDGNPVVHYSYNLPDDKKIDAYAAEDYTAFAVDADDAESVQIFSEERESAQADTTVAADGKAE